MMLSALLLLLLSILSCHVDAQCSSETLETYMRCVAENPCLCSNCDADPTDDFPEIVLNEPPQSCQDVNRIFCPMVRCCSACEEIALEWYTCTWSDFSMSQMGEDCPQICDAFDFGDVEGDCSPTGAPTAVPTVQGLTSEPTVPVQPPTSEPTVELPCREQVLDYQDCIANVPCSNDCLLDYSLLMSSLDPCVSDVYCPLKDCCPDCRDSLESVLECVATDIQNGACADYTVCAEEVLPSDMPSLEPTRHEIVLAETPTMLPTATSDGWKRQSLSWVLLLLILVLSVLLATQNSNVDF
jgi:hypothetical protein